ncbi:MAG TPA: response regulator [Candidatus Saccharimonadales bacterium]|nr:response regulator [Candidatus Saccharimonadales bacterium]
MKKILIIEPDYLLSKTYERYLTQQSFRVVLAGDAATAIKKLDKALVDVIVLELQLPGHSGFEFLHELRSYPEWLSIPVVINSVIPKTELQTKDLNSEFGIVNYLYKPTTSLSELGYILGRHLSTQVV